MIIVMSGKLWEHLSRGNFQRRFGVKPKTFQQMVKSVKSQWAIKIKRGKKPKLCVEEQILVTLESRSTNKKIRLISFKSLTLEFFLGKFY
jgi:hypothetical protein